MNPLETMLIAGILVISLTYPTCLVNGQAQSCTVNGTVYNHGETISVAPDHCSTQFCDNGQVGTMDDECAFFTPECDGILEKPADQCCQICHATTTTPAGPPDSCVVDGVVYGDGVKIIKNLCDGTICVDGMVVVYHEDCVFNPIPCDGGVLEDVEGECCPVCRQTTTTPSTSKQPTSSPPTTRRPTTPGLPPGSCEYDGRLFENGEMVYESRDKCYGMFCSDGEMVSYDDKCAFYTPVCNGISTKLPDQCCPVCDNTTTTTTARPSNGTCVIRGRVYALGERTNIARCEPCECGPDGLERCMAIDCGEVTDCAYPYRPTGACCYTCGTDGLHSTMLAVLLVVCVTVYNSWLSQ